MSSPAPAGLAFYLNADALALFVLFVRLNPHVMPDDPLMIRAFTAYQTTVVADAPG